LDSGALVVVVIIIIILCWKGNIEWFLFVHSPIIEASKSYYTAPKHVFLTSFWLRVRAQVEVASNKASNRTIRVRRDMMLSVAVVVNRLYSKNVGLMSSRESAAYIQASKAEEKEVRRSQLLLSCAANVIVEEKILT